MYTKDITSLLQLLNVSEQNTLLHIEPSENTGEAWYARVALVRGDVTMCQVLRVRDDAPLIYGPSALRWLTTVGRLFYEEERERATDPAPLLPPSAQGQPLVSPVMEQGSAEALQPFVRVLKESLYAGNPRRTALGEREGGATIMGREHRLVFLLVDGFHTFEEIASLLHKTPERIKQILTDLQHQGRIE